MCVVRACAGGVGTVLIQRSLHSGCVRNGCLVRRAGSAGVCGVQSLTSL